MRRPFGLLATLLAGGLSCAAASADANAADALEALMHYHGDWAVSAEHPGSGAAPGSVDRLHSACTKFVAFLACEQAVNGKPLALIVYTVADRAGEFHTGTIAPSELAGGRGTMTVAGDR